MTSAAAQPDPHAQSTDGDEQRTCPAPAPPGPRNEYWPLAILVGLAFVAGLLLVRDFGMSTDEYGNATVGRLALDAYTGSQAYFGLGSLKDHGPIYFMIFSATSTAISRIPGWLLPDGRHLTNYVTFLAGLVAFHVICRRILSRSSALVATALFATQPVIFGSAFINQKDIPFMTFFLAVIALGLVAGDARRAEDEEGASGRSLGFRSSLTAFFGSLAREWHGLGRRRRRIVLVGTVLALILMLDLFVFGFLFRLGESLVVAAYRGQAPWPIQSLYALVATDAHKTSLPEYLHRYARLFSELRLGLLAILSGAGLVVFGTALPSLPGLLRSPEWKVGYPALVAGAVLLGCTISIRQIGLFAGGLVSIYLLYRGRMRAIPPLVLYWVIAAGVAYATWPYLWPDPIGRLLLSFEVIPEFGEHNVLFQGESITSAILPWSYLPVLLGIDFTEPTLALAILGFGVGLWRFARRKINRFVFAMVAAWLVVPVVWQISERVPLYNNLRHFLFVVPVFFVLAGIGFEWLASITRRTWGNAVLAALVITPGVLGNVWLHPYEYTYFNGMAGGVSGAAGYYDIDYWCTSLKEGIEIANRAAASGETIEVYGPLESAAPYARDDVKLVDRHYPPDTADLLVVCTHRFDRGWWADDYRLLSQVGRGRAVFAEVWRKGTTAGAASSP